VTSVQLIGTERDHDKHASQDLLVTDQECQKITCGPVRPVRILDDQDQRAALGQMLEQGQHLLEHSRPRLGRVGVDAGLPEFRQQPGQFPCALARQQGRDTIGTQVADKVPQDPGEGRERQALRAQLQAVPAQQPGGCPGPQAPTHPHSGSRPT
jgi:hypothetical protein